MTVFSAFSPAVLSSWLLYKAGAAPPGLFAFLADARGSTVAFSIVTFVLVKKVASPMNQEVRSGKGPGNEDCLTNQKEETGSEIRKRHWGHPSEKGSQGRLKPVT